MSGISACPWDGSQVRPVIGWPFPQSAPSRVPALLVGRTNFGLKVLWVGWCPAWLQDSALAPEPPQPALFQLSPYKTMSHQSCRPRQVSPSLTRSPPFPASRFECSGLECSTSPHPPMVHSSQWFQWVRRQSRADFSKQPHKRAESPEQIKWL